MTERTPEEIAEAIKNFYADERERSVPAMVRRAVGLVLRHLQGRTAPGDLDIPPPPKGGDLISRSALIDLIRNLPGK